MSTLVALHLTAIPCVPEVGDFYGVASISQSVVLSSRYSCRRSFIRTLARNFDIEESMVPDLFDISAQPVALLPLPEWAY